MSHLTDSEVAEFKMLVKDEYGIELTDDDARVQAEQFIACMYPLFKFGARRTALPPPALGDASQR